MERPMTPAQLDWANGLVGLGLRLRVNSPLRTIVDYKQDAGGLGVFLVVADSSKHQGVMPAGVLDGYLEVYQPYPERLMNGLRSEVEVVEYHTITSLGDPPPMVKGRTVFRAEPGPEETGMTGG